MDTAVISQIDEIEICRRRDKGHAQMTSAKNFEILSPSSAPKKFCSYRLCR